MASITKDPKGNVRIQFIAGDGKRRSIPLGDIDQDEAVTINKRVGALNVAKRKGRAWDEGLTRWVDRLSDELHAKLANVGLVPSRTPAAAPAEATVPTLGQFLDEYIAKKKEVLEPNTIQNFTQTRTQLINYFTAGRALDTITAADAEDWQTSLLRRYKPATIAIHTKKAK